MQERLGKPRKRLVNDIKTAEKPVAFKTRHRDELVAGADANGMTLSAFVEEWLEIGPALAQLVRESAARDDAMQIVRLLVQGARMQIMIDELVERMPEENLQRFLCELASLDDLTDYARVRESMRKRKSMRWFANIYSDCPSEFLGPFAVPSDPPTEH